MTVLLLTLESLAIWGYMMSLFNVKLIDCIHKKVSDSAGFEVESVLFSTLCSIFYIKSSEKLVLPFCVKPSCSCGCRNVLYFSITLVLLDVGLHFVIFTSQWGYHTSVTGCQHCHNSRTWSFSHYDHYLLLLSSSVMNLRNR